MKTVRFDLQAINTALTDVQNKFTLIVNERNFSRPEITDECRLNLMEGYVFIDYLLEQGLELYEPGNTSRLLELNNLVLCGSNQLVRHENKQHIEATYERFYERQSGDIDAMVAMLKKHFTVNVWRRAATAYVHILAQPQLYIEGNHRTATLIMSYILAQEGKPPFVLTSENAAAYFAHSLLAKDIQVQGLDRVHKLPRLIVVIARLLKEYSRESYLL